MAVMLYRVLPLGIKKVIEMCLDDNDDHEEDKMQREPLYVEENHQLFNMYPALEQNPKECLYSIHYS